MKKSNLLLLATIAIPFIYLATIYGDLPAKVPIHYNLKGEADGWGSKAVLWILPVVGPLLTAFIMKVFVPLVDFEKKLEKMGRNYEKMTLAVVAAMSALITWILASSGQEQLSGPDFLLIIMGFLYVVLGNYLPAVKPNAAVGIRLPWTFKSDTVWRKTHHFSGRIWIAGGLLLIILGFVLPMELGLFVFLIITILICLIPSIYSWQLYKKEEAKGEI